MSAKCVIYSNRSVERITAVTSEWDNAFVRRIRIAGHVPALFLGKESKKLIGIYGDSCNPHMKKVHWCVCVCVCVCVSVCLCEWVWVCWDAVVNGSAVSVCTYVGDVLV